MNTNHWTIVGSHGETIFGSTEAPDGLARGVALLAHGFKGYKDYGMFPWLSRQLASIGLISHRFNFSHSGMQAGIDEFERPDLFEKDTWNRQVEDLKVLADTFRQSELPLYIIGHSRGGVACLLATGRGQVSPDKLVSIAAPSTCLSMSEDVQEDLLRSGFIVSPSARTNQDLRVGSCFLQEQLDDPANHDLLQLATQIECPVLVVHGEEDDAVPVSASSNIANQTNGACVVIDNANHVFNTTNPFPNGDCPSPQLQALWNATQSFLLES